jgi:hypothetical protein
MACDELGPIGRAHPVARARITVTLFGAFAAVVLTAGVTIGASGAAARAAGAPTSIGHPLAADPDGRAAADPEQSDPAPPNDPAESPTPSESPPGPVETTTPPPPTDRPPAQTTPPPPPIGPPPPAPGPQGPDPTPLGVNVTTGDIVLAPAYWNADSTLADLRVTVANTGRRAEAVRLSYTLPAGLTDAGTAGCVAAGGQSFSCAPWTVAPGTRFGTHVRVRVDGAAWRRIPLSGSVRVTAGATGSGAAVRVSDAEGFAVLFPPGPPVPGVSLTASEVNFDVTGQASTLDVRFGNTGRTDAGGTMEVLLPAGVSVPTLPAGCASTGAGRTRCDLGAIPAGRSGTAKLPIAATAEAQRAAPLSGGVIGTLTPRVGKAKRLQMSFRITAVGSATPAAPDGVAPTGSQGALPPAHQVANPGGGLSGVQRAAIALIVLSVVLVLLALALAITSLRRRMGGPPAPEAPPLTE